ncbi:MAG TPA: hypothetical protein VL966_01820 [Alphaproteobacteria bacterium]|jgi:hypothetical protein|nr:hypothetical protein [Alphaproteobacteria bacterium]
MTSDAAVQHSPRPGRAGTRGGVLALLAAPAAWSLAHIVTYCVASVSCFPGHEPRSTTEGLGWVFPLLIAIYIAALIVSGASGIAAYRAWTTARAHPHGETGHTVEIAAGRGRFLALWGMLSSGTFFILLAFDTISLLMVPLCSH